MASEPRQTVGAKPISAPTAEEVVENDDSRAEELAIAAGVDPGSAKARRLAARIERLSSADTHLYRVIIWGLYLVAFSAAALFLTLVYHLISPCPFLPPERLADIKQLLFSGAVGAIATRLSGDYFTEDKKGRD